MVLGDAVDYRMDSVVRDNAMIEVLHLLPKWNPNLHCCSMSLSKIFFESFTDQP